MPRARTEEPPDITPSFSVTERRRTRERNRIEIESRIYVPAAKNNATMRKLLEIANPANEADAAISKARAEEDIEEIRRLETELERLALDAVYEQISGLLRDAETGENPDPEWLGEVIDIEDARALLEHLMPSGGAEGNGGG
jgi:hypothetical protein